MKRPFGSSPDQKDVWWVPTGNHTADALTSKYLLRVRRNMPGMMEGNYPDRPCEFVVFPSDLGTDHGPLTHGWAETLDEAKMKAEEAAKTIGAKQ